MSMSVRIQRIGTHAVIFSVTDGQFSLFKLGTLILSGLVTCFSTKIR